MSPSDKLSSLFDLAPDAPSRPRPHSGGLYSCETLGSGFGSEVNTLNIGSVPFEPRGVGVVSVTCLCMDVSGTQLLRSRDEGDGGREPYSFW